MYLRQRGEPQTQMGGPSAVAGSGVAAAGGRVAYVAERDIVVVNPAKDEFDVALRGIRDEISHIERRFRQLDEQREEWESIVPHEYAPYQPLPAEKWNTYGVSLGLGDTDHEVISEAYEQANDFNHEMQTPPAAFGEDEPDLEGLRKAFRRARAVLDKLSSNRQR